MSGLLLFQPWSVVGKWTHGGQFQSHLTFSSSTVCPHSLNSPSSWTPPSPAQGQHSVLWLTRSQTQDTIRLQVLVNVLTVWGPCDGSNACKCTNQSRAFCFKGCEDSLLTSFPNEDILLPSVGGVSLNTGLKGKKGRVRGFTPRWCLADRRPPGSPRGEPGSGCCFWWTGAGAAAAAATKGSWAGWTAGWAAAC